MKIIKTKIKDLVIIEPSVFKDNRGHFTELYNKGDFKKSGIKVDFVQDNCSFSKKKGTLRGLHFQNYPYTQAKLVYCTEGAVLDIVVDLRKNSATYKEWFSIKLSKLNRKQLFIPRGCAHGFLTLADNTEFWYKTDNHYNKQSERAIRYNDPELDIKWATKNPLLSPKDKVALFLKDCDINLK